MLKLKERERAIKLRRKGCSYSEILKEVPVAKSTLSLWLRDVGLSKRQKQRLTKKKLAAALRGATKRKKQRLAITERIKTKARKEARKISEKDLWFIGISLYWAEGSKQKEHLVSQRVKLVNSDPMIIKVFLKWLLKSCKVSRKDIYFRIYIHETARDRLIRAKQHWTKITNFPIDYFQKVSWKKNKIRTVRKNIGKNYYGLLEINVKKSTNFNRKIAGWIEGIYENC